MAKIYETKEDFERDKLKEQADRLHYQARVQNETGLALSGGGLVAEVFRMDKPQTRGWLSFVTWGLILTGIVQSVRSWFTAGQAHTLDMERERMGPQKVVFPAGADDAGDCGCKLKSHSQSVEPRTLLEQAAKSDNGMLGKN